MNTMLILRYACPLYRVLLLILVLCVPCLSYAHASYDCVMGIPSAVPFMLELALISETWLKLAV